MKKPAVSLLIALVLSLAAFSGCGGGDSAPAPPADMVSTDTVSPAEDVFVPLPVEPDEMGNMWGNHSNGGLAATQGDFIYYAIQEGSNSGIYKTGGGETLKLADIPGDSLNVVGSYLYFHHEHNLGEDIVYRMRTDGVGEPAEILRGEKILYPQVVGEYIYYVKSGGKLCRSGSDGRNEEILVAEDVSVFSPFLAAPSGVFYTYWKDWEAHLRRVDVDGTGEKTLVKNQMAQSMALVGDTLYFIHGRPSFTNSADWIISVNAANGKKKETVSSFKTPGFNASSDTIYYIAMVSNNYSRHKNSLRRMDFDGGNKATLSREGELISDINVAGDWVYYTAYSPDYGVYRVKSDGTGYERID